MLQWLAIMGVMGMSGVTRTFTLQCTSPLSATRLEVRSPDVGEAYEYYRWTKAGTPRQLADVRGDYDFSLLGIAAGAPVMAVKTGATRFTQFLVPGMEAARELTSLDIEFLLTDGSSRPRQATRENFSCSRVAADAGFVELQERLIAAYDNLQLVHTNILKTDLRGEALERVLELERLGAGRGLILDYDFVDLADGLTPLRVVLMEFQFDDGSGGIEAYAIDGAFILAGTFNEDSSLYWDVRE